MRRVILIAAMSALVLAKPNPETYRETEDFQYSRSSSDDGHKSGYYGAQRGNTGGNYERAHNMDHLAQHQMSGLVSQVDGELGEGAKTRTGSVYTAANSRGIYGSGNHDLSNLKGRNFAEGESIGISQSHLGLTAQNSGYRDYAYGGMNSAGYSSSSHAQGSRYSGYQASGHTDQRQTDNLQAVDMSQGHSRYENDNQAGYNMNHHTQYGSRSRSEFDQSSSNLYGSSGFNGDSQSRYITTPVRVELRPGGRVAIPIAAPIHQVSRSSLSKDQNTINSDAEVLNQETNVKPTNKVKHYESSYSYRKEWEKHHSLPGDVSVIIPTETPFPKNSELYDDAQLLQSSKDQFENANLQTGHVNSEHRSQANSAASSRSRFQTGFNTQQSQSGFNAHQSQSSFNAQQSSAASDSRANAYGHGAQHSGMAADLTSAAENIDLKPKSYQSSYSYHKSWERQGDPYVIKPVGEWKPSNGQASQRLMAGSSNSAAYSSHQYGSHSRQGQQNYFANGDCDDEGHVRVARSYNTEQEEQRQSQWQQDTHQNLEDMGQQTQSQWGNLEDLGQQQQLNKWDNLQELGQQTQTQWDNLQQLGQQSQNQWDNLQQLGQQTQNQWDNLQQLGQQTQDKFENLGQQTQSKWDKLEDLGQHTQRDLEQTQNENLEDFSQHNQKEDVLTNFEQQANGEDIVVDQKSYTQQESHPVSTIWDRTPDFEAQSNTASADNINQQIQSGNNQENIDNINKHHIEGFEQNQQNNWFQSQDKDINSDNFMKPTPHLHDDCDHDSQKHTASSVPFNMNENPNLFSVPLSNTGFHPWPQINEQGNPWNFNYNQNTNYNHGNNYWHRDEYLNNQFAHNSNSYSYSNSFSTSNADKSLNGLWDNVDNIPGVHSATGVRSDDNYSDGYSNFHSYNQNGNDMHNSFSWGYIPAYPNFDTPQINTVETKDQKEHHNLFGEDIQSTSTTVKPNNVLLHNPKPVENATVITQEKQPSHHDQNVNSKDEGRGDIGPEETVLEYTTDKPDKTPEEIEYLSITKETHNTNPHDTIAQTNTNKIKKEDTTSQSVIPITTLTIPISTTEKSDNFHSVNPKPTNDAILHDKPLPNLQNGKPQKQTTTENEDIPQSIQQENFEQQFTDDFGQQLQGSWFANNLQQGYDQQNMEQQFEVFHQQDDSKPKSPEEIETLSLTREMHNANTNNINIQPNVMKNLEEAADSKLNVHENSNENKQYTLPSTLQSQQASSTPSIQISTTTKSNNMDSVDFKPSFELNPLTEIHKNKPQEQTAECADNAEDIQQLQQYLEQQFAENLDQQVQGSWTNDNLQQGFDQQNMDQQFEVFQHENMHDQNLQDFGQQEQSSLQSFENLHQLENKNIPRFPANFEQIPSSSENSRDINVEPEFPPHTGLDQTNTSDKSIQKKQNIGDTQSSPGKPSEPIPSPVETSTPGPGFWKSVGNKFTNAKNKVFSWFKQS